MYSLEQENSRHCKLSEICAIRWNILMNWNAWTTFPSEYATRHITRAPLINFHFSTFFLISFGSFIFAFLVSPSHKWDAGKLNSENSLQFNIRRSTLDIPQVNNFLSFFKITFGHFFLNCSYRLLVTAKVVLIAWIVGNFIILNKISIILFNNIPDTIYLLNLDWFGELFVCLWEDHLFSPRADPCS